VQEIGAGDRLEQLAGEVRAPPFPDDAKASCPGCAFASSTTSCTVPVGSEAETAMIKGSLASRMTGAKSVAGSYGRLA